MRMLMQVSCPNDAFNAAVKDGSAGAKIKRILAEQKPEAVYFTAMGGFRTGILIVDLADASKIPSLAEPWFLLFNAEIRLSPVMSPEDLGRAGLDELGKTWA